MLPLAEKTFGNEDNWCIGRTLRETLQIRVPLVTTESQPVPDAD
jgi:hypothetical protein